MLIELPGDGVTLRADLEGPPDGVPIVFLHGGGQTRGAWREAVEAMAARGLRAMSVDLRGHGDSDWAPDGDYRMERMSNDVRAVAGSFSQKPFLVGASLGGWSALLAAAEAPVSPARGLILVDIVPRVEVEGADAVIHFMRSAPNGFATLEEASEVISAYLPHRKRPTGTQGLKRNLRHGPDGRWRWHWDPRIIDDRNRVLPHLMTPRFEAAARALSVPTLLVRGGSSKVVSLEGAREFLALVPGAEMVDVAGSDHMVAGDQNDAFNVAIIAFVSRHLT